MIFYKLVSLSGSVYSNNHPDRVNDSIVGIIVLKNSSRDSKFPDAFTNKLLLPSLVDKNLEDFSPLISCVVLRLFVPSTS